MMVPVPSALLEMVDPASGCCDSPGEQEVFSGNILPMQIWPQGEEEGNPYEAHVRDHLTPEAYRSLYGPFREEYYYGLTATFIREFHA